MPHTRPGPGSSRPALILLLLAATLASLLLIPNPALAGDYTQILCANPDTGQGVARDGILPSGFTSASTRSVGADAASSASCSPGVMTASRGLLLTANVPFTTNNPNRDGVGTLTYTVPTGTTLQSVELYVAGTTAAVSNHMTMTLHGGEALDAFGSPLYFDCEWASNCVSVGDLSSPYVAANRHVWTTPPIAGYSMTLGCTIPDATWTCTGNSSEKFRMFGGKSTLRDASNPQQVGDAIGGLVTDSPLRGLEDATVNATDTGSGLYRMSVLVDGQVVRSQVIDSNGGACADVNPANSDPYEFADGQPCKLSAGGTIQLDTTTLAEGAHAVAVAIEDASGNSTTIANRSVTVDNVPDVAPSPAGGDGSTATGGGAATGSGAGAGATGAGAGLAFEATRGALNGIGATDSARLTAYWQHNRASTLSARYGRRNVIRGRLTDDHGTPIRGAQVDVVSTAAMRGAVAAQQGLARTGSDGSFTVTLPANASSRRIALRYRSHVGDVAAAAERVLKLRVTAGLSFKVTPRTAHRGSTIRISGRLLGGPYPRHGKVLELQARNPHGRWITFRTIRTRRGGRFATRYTFRRPGPATYDMRARARESGDYPFATGISHSRRIRVR